MTLPDEMLTPLSHIFTAACPARAVEGANGCQLDPSGDVSTADQPSPTRVHVMFWSVVKFMSASHAGVPRATLRAIAP
jgi:hypothetical protein